MGDRRLATEGNVQMASSQLLTEDRTHLREWKMETGERGRKTREQRSVAAGAGGAAGRVEDGVYGEGCRCSSEIK